MRKHSYLLKVISSFAAVFFIAGSVTPISFAAVDVERYSDTARRYSDSAIDYLDALINFSQFREMKKQFQKTYRIMVSPYFKSGFDYTSNTYRGPGDGSEDGIWTVTPGVTATAVRDWGRVGASYEADVRTFTHQHKQNTIDQRFAAMTDFKMTDHVSFRASEHLSQTGATAGRKGLEPVDYLDNTVDAMIAYKKNGWTGELGYENFVRNYQHQLFDRLDYNDNKLIARVSADVAENFKEFMEFNVGQVDFPDVSTRDASYIEILPGIEGVIGGVTALASVGYHRRNLEKDARNDLDMVVTSVVLKRQFQPRTSGEVALLRRPQEGSYDAQTFYIENFIYAGLTHLFTRKLRGKAGVSFSNNRYQGLSTVGGVITKRRDNLFSMLLGLDYAAREWFVVHLGYLLERRDSIISDFDYTENRLSLGVTVPV